VRVCTGVTGVLAFFGIVGAVTTWLVADGVPLDEGTVKFILGIGRLNPGEPEGTNTKKATISTIIQTRTKTAINAGFRFPNQVKKIFSSHVLCAWVRQPGLFLFYVNR
jgi:hypothetical protein